MTYPSMPVPMVALVTLSRSLWSGRLPNVTAGQPFWCRHDQVAPLEDAGYARPWTDADPPMPPAEPDNTVHGSAGFSAGTTNGSPGLSLLTPDAPAPRRQN
jgi:hypothetical protein